MNAAQQVELVVRSSVISPPPTPPEFMYVISVQDAPSCLKSAPSTRKSQGASSRQPRHQRRSIVSTPAHRKLTSPRVVKKRPAIENLWAPAAERRRGGRLSMRVRQTGPDLNRGSQHRPSPPRRLRRASSGARREPRCVETGEPGASWCGCPT